MLRAFDDRDRVRVIGRVVAIVDEYFGGARVVYGTHIARACSIRRVVAFDERCDVVLDVAMTVAIVVFETSAAVEDDHHVEARVDRGRCFKGKRIDVRFKIGIYKDFFIIDFLFKSKTIIMLRQGLAGGAVKR